MKGERTRRQVVEQAAALFNEGGYRATSISEVMEATGLKKGGIYRHFESKDELSLLAFDFAVEKMALRFQKALTDETTARGKLRAIVRVYSQIPQNPPVPGGCPLLNASVEADDAYPALKARAREEVTRLLRAVQGIVTEGKRTGEFRADLAAKAESTTLVAALEGAVMIAKIQGNQQSMNLVARTLYARIESLMA